MKNLFRLSIVIAVLSIPLITAQAEPQASKDWLWDISVNTSAAGDKYVYAATVNSGTRIFGQFCDLTEGSCYYMVELGITCVTDSEYPTLINSNIGVYSVTLVCEKMFNSYKNLFYINPFETIDRIAKSADNIGFAVAMEAGTFKVIRFSLSGSNHAIKMMRMGAEILQKKTPATQYNLKSEEYL